MLNEDCLLMMMIRWMDRLNEFAMVMFERKWKLNKIFDYFILMILLIFQMNFIFKSFLFIFLNLQICWWVNSFVWQHYNQRHWCQNGELFSDDNERTCQSKHVWSSILSKLSIHHRATDSISLHWATSHHPSSCANILLLCANTIVFKWNSISAY